MGLFGTIKSGLEGSPSILMLIVLGVADQLWGDNIFNCPCGTQFSRILFTLPFLTVPPIVIITVDTPWRFVRTSFKCDLTLRCCRWIYRPVIIAVIWMVFSLLQPKFGSCMFTVESCACSEKEKAEGCTEEDTAGKEKAAFTRVVAACIILGVGALILLIGIIFILWMCANNQCHRCCVEICRPCRKCCDSCRKLPLVGVVFPEESKLRAQKCLEDTVLAMELKTKTIDKLRSKGLLKSSKQLAALTPEQLAKMTSISAGQIEILRRFPKERLLMQTLIVMGLTPESVVKLREQGIDDDRLAYKLTDADYRHIATVITKKQLKILRNLPRKWALIQMLLRAGLEGATLVKLREDDLLDEDELMNLTPRQLTDIEYAVALDQLNLLRGYGPKLYLVKALVGVGLEAETLTALSEGNILDERKLQSLTDTQLAELEKNLPEDQLKLLKTCTAKLPAYIWLCKEPGVEFEQILDLQQKGDQQIIEIIDEINTFRQANEPVPQATKRKLEQILADPSAPTPITRHTSGPPDAGRQSPSDHSIELQTRENARLVSQEQSYNGQESIQMGTFL
ncbi:hypothetical protein BaRGS_00028790 [Batillaria attramentaria]|uniref:Uncharacterized protein n=1 Tax=Batillaria attramentaria TaxID=370345 RepID=A0ABD0JYH8_9CAEN